MIVLELAGVALALALSSQALAVGGLVEVNVYARSASPKPAETITIRCDSHRSLAALGAIREEPRQPRPFPGFVPDA
jgi:hypothetical protein